MQRVIWHWTAGTNAVSTIDRQHYHEIIDGRGDVYRGVRVPEDNLNISDGTYAAHTLNCNTGSIGIAVAGMHGARERPFSWGSFPLNNVQIDKLVERTAYYCKKYNIPVTRETVLSHAEVQQTLKIKQNGKWDISVLPGMVAPDDPIKVGDILRARVAKALGGRVIVVQPEKPASTGGGFWAWIKSLFSR